MSTHDFDFFRGTWHVAHRRLKERLAGCKEWESFGGHCTAQLILGGQGNLDDNVIEFPGGAYRAITMRTYDPKTDEWAIWWLDARNPHALDVPMKGRFADGAGTFFAGDTFGGKPIKVRFIWSDISRDSARWNQAFSADGGEMWETNWEMRFTRER
ncbi:MAG TPA: hypothetical protein VGG36_09370 [Rhizomicrobium sp.]|jgi:hypothetical protein